MYRFDIKDNDHYINLRDGDKIIFNVLNNKEKVSIKFGIINRNFCADKIVVFTQKEFPEKDVTNTTVSSSAWGPESPNPSVWR